MAWIMYADENNDRLVNGNSHDSDAWVHWESGYSEDQKERAIENGALYSVCKNLKLYKCPTGKSGEVITYTIVDAMNGHLAISGATPAPVKTRSKIKNATLQAVFMDEGKLTPSSWTVYYYQELWWDAPAVRHSQGTNWSFADGHSEFWKWMDLRTVKIGAAKDDTPIDPGVSDASWATGNPDLHRVQKAAWAFMGRMGYSPSAVQ